MNNGEFTQNENAEKAPYTQAANVENAPEKKLQVGPIVGSIIIVILLILGGLYFIGKKVSDERLLEPKPQEIMEESDPAPEALYLQDTSDEINSIQGDLDAELKDIETELNF